MVNCGKDTNGSQFNFQEPCQWLIVVKILMVQFNSLTFSMANC